MITRILMLTAICAWVAGTQPAATPAKMAHADNYVLGAGDQITLWAVDLEEVSQRPVRIDASGMVTLPLVGRVQAAGLTVAEFEQRVAEKFKAYQHHPQVAVNVSEYRSQPVSVLGAVNSPGVHHLQGTVTLLETISAAGGLRQDAGSTIVVSRRRAAGALPLPGARVDATGEYSIAEIELAGLTNASNPELNITIMPQDVITVSRAAMIYVMGEVTRPGAYTLGEHRNMPVLEALSLAGGATRTGSRKKSKILRPSKEPGANRIEQPIDLQKVLEGASNDVYLQADDILFVPDNKPKSAALRAVEAAIATGSGIVIWRSVR